MVASGNDFVLIEGISQRAAGDLGELARSLCDRKFGAGADGMLFLEKSKSADIRMRIFNADGSQAQMCGNGARCVAFYLGRRQQIGRKLKIETAAGVVLAQYFVDVVKVRLTDPQGIRAGIPIDLGDRRIKVNFINTGVPHAVIFVEGLDEIDCFNLGRQIRYHQAFAPAGTNVDFVEVTDNHSIKVRTYERGVEDETLACGTGSAAAALVASFTSSVADVDKIDVRTKGGETLKVYFKRIRGGFSDVWLEGTAAIVYKGEYYV